MRKIIFTDEELREFIKDTIEEYTEHNMIPNHDYNHVHTETNDDVNIHHNIIPFIEETMDNLKKQYVNYNFVTLHGFGNPLVNYTHLKEGA